MKEKIKRTKKPKKLPKMMSLQVVKKQGLPKKKPKKRTKAGSSIKITIKKPSKKKGLSRLKSQTLKKGGLSGKIKKTPKRSLSQKNIHKKDHLSIKKPKIESNRRSFTIGRMRDAMQKGENIKNFKVSNIIKTVSSRSRRLKRMNRSVYIGGDTRRKFLQNFFELAHSSKAVGVGNEEKPQKKIKKDSDSSLEEFDIYQTNSSAALTGRSVENEFEIDFEKEETKTENPEIGTLQKVDSLPIVYAPISNAFLSKTKSFPLETEQQNKPRPRASFIFGQIPSFNNMGQELQCIQEYGKTKPEESQKKKLVFGLTHCPGKNHIKKTSKKVLSSKTRFNCKKTETKE